MCAAAISTAEALKRLKHLLCHQISIAAARQRIMKYLCAAAGNRSWRRHLQSLGGQAWLSSSGENEPASQHMAGRLIR